MSDPIHCTDGGCVFGHPGGMHTNGGCKCLPQRNRVTFEERRELDRKVRGMRAELERTKAELAESQKQVDRLNHKRGLTIDNNGKLLAENAKLREAGEALAKLVKVMNPGEVNGFWDGEKWHDIETAIPAWRAAVGGGEESDGE